MNSSSILNRTEEFFDRLERALGRPSPQNRDVVAEVRADFLAQVEALQRGGVSEGDAVDQVLGQMGEPDALAAEMKVAMPPLSSGPVAVIRYILAGGLVLWTLLLMWTFRAWDYGLSGGMFLALGLHLPVIMLLWPRIIWRKNWLFGAVPAAVLVLVAIGLNTVGTSHTEVLMVEDGVLVAPPGSELPDVGDGLRWQLLVLLGALALAFGVLFGMIQQARQRLVVLVAVLLPVLAVEGAFQWEERVFRQQRERLERLVAEQGASMPQRGPIKELGVGDPERANGGTYALSENGKDFTMWWPRPLSSSSSICYGSEDGRIWVND